MDDSDDDCERFGMGVPHLTASLRPYATPVVFGKGTLSGHEKAPSQGKVIDGPAFAYYIYHACLASRQHAQGPLEAVPSYREIGDETIAWLDQVNQEMGLKFENFYFDGLLPLIKRPVRLSRLQGYLKQLAAYRKLTPKGVPYATVTVTSTEHNLLVARHVPSKLTALPAPPFLVPAVIEVLMEHLPYKALVRVVPGEADYYCARKEDHIIFTSDSDLLVYDLGVNGSVIFFDDLEEAVSDENQPVLKGLLYQPQKIANRLGLKGIEDLAYEMWKQPSATFNEALALAREHTDDIRDSDNYRLWRLDYEFGDKYDVPFRGTVQRHFATNKRLLHILRRLDPRVAECINQHGYDEAADEDSDLPFYLPFLIEDPTRATAWDTELPLRRLGYSLLYLALPKEERPYSITEYKRRGQIINEEEIKAIKLVRATWWCELLIPTLEGLNFTITVDGRSRKMTTTEFWKAFGIYQILRWHHSKVRKIPNRSDLKALVTNPCCTTQTWAQIHLFAQYQAILYSARILQQFTQIAYQVNKGTSTTPAYELEKGPFASEFTLLLSKLHRLTKEMPCVEEIFIAPKDFPRSTSESQIWDVIIRTVFEFCGIEEEESTLIEKEDLSRAEKKKRKRAESKVKEEVKPLNVQSNNMYNILSFD
ncbi:MAG: hypothetical protein M1812_002478 [Candelaria pacifica]|nr:MAG: hypothetical protein M1812_002478 [Candelaria pacifica]